MLSTYHTLQSLATWFLTFFLHILPSSDYKIRLGWLFDILLEHPGEKFNLRHFLIVHSSKSVLTVLINFCHILCISFALNHCCMSFMNYFQFYFKTHLGSWLSVFSIGAGTHRWMGLSSSPEVLWLRSLCPSMCATTLILMALHRELAS